MTRRALAVLGIVLGCTSTTEPEFAATPELGQPFELRVGEQASVADAGLLVYFVEVSEDSRCPSNALILCVWEGNGAVVVEATPVDGVARMDTLHTTLDPKTIDVGTFVLELEQLDPYPEDVTPIPVAEYVARFVVSSGD